MPAFPQAPYTQEFKDKCKTLSDNNTNVIKVIIFFKFVIYI